MHAREVLDADHAGLEDVKDRITEYIAVRKLRRERGIADEGRGAGAILTLIGPPGTGKTSIGESIARATGREFVRMSLGGVRDEAEIRGHRRTYIGALPGRLVRALRDAGTMNPVIMLDEVDKVGADWRGDPSRGAARGARPGAEPQLPRPLPGRRARPLARCCSSPPRTWPRRSPAPLLDRMEVVRFDGYTTEEKVAIARGYLCRASSSATACAPDEVEVSDEVVRTIVTEYTREAGVRNLERELGKLLRKTATRLAAGEVEAPVDDRPRGGARRRSAASASSRSRSSAPRSRASRPGLSVTGAGGDVLFIEATSMPGKEGFVLTGQLGRRDEGVGADRALLRARPRRPSSASPTSAFEDREFHLHVPAGAIPKDGPSAGITMTTALASLLSGRPVKHTVGMTGEVTLQGRVLPIGGLKQKVLAAHAAGSHRRDPARAQPRRPRRRARGGARADDASTR